MLQTILLMPLQELLMQFLFLLAFVLLIITLWKQVAPLASTDKGSDAAVKTQFWIFLKGY